MKKIQHHADICVVGAGLAGMCAALGAARHGSKVILVNDRPVLGGNCSSEIRMWPLGAHGSGTRETGIFEEIVLENMRRNPFRTYPIWDSVLYDIVTRQEGLTLILNCSIQDAEVKETKEGHQILSVTGWQLTTYQYHTITADIFLDCSGDSILAELTGARFRKGREARSEFMEEAAPLEADTQTMGNSCMLQARETDQKVEYIAPFFARDISEQDLTGRNHNMKDLRGNNFWWLELGGDRDTLNDCESIRDDLVALSYGTWDHIKNKEGHEADHWDLDFAGWLPGKRESRRYEGPHILTQNEVAAGGKFDDIVAYGGWKIDDHPPKGFNNFAVPTRYYDCPSPFGIPYRCLYSVNVKNLMFAGRNISVTHAAMAASRVMATCAILGQAAGTAAYLAHHYGMLPGELYSLSGPEKDYIHELQQLLMLDDCWLPGLKREIADICRKAELSIEIPEDQRGDQQCILSGNESDPEVFRNGLDRPENGEDNGCVIPLGAKVTYTLEEKTMVHTVRLILDSDLDRETVKGGDPSIKDCPTICNRPYHMPPFEFPTTMLDEFQLLGDGELLCHIAGNRQRHLTISVDKPLKTLSLIPIRTTDKEEKEKRVHIFSFDFS